MGSNDFLPLCLDRFEQLRAMGVKTLDQLSEDDIHWSPDPETNSIAVIVQHVHGNMLSRFTDFLTSDGEKPNRHRDEEFIEQKHSLVETKRLWHEGWECVFATLKPLTQADLAREVFILGESHTAMEAILRQLIHYAYHVGQIVLLAKMCRGGQWKTLSIPRGKSEVFNAELTNKK